MLQPYIKLAPSENRGRGVFSTQSIPAGTDIEISPVLVLSTRERKFIEKTKLSNYVFEWGETKKKVCVAFGLVSMYNHSYDANCEYEMDFDADLITIRTVKKIKRGEELYINYNATPDDKKPVWFDTV